MDVPRTEWMVKHDLDRVSIELVLLPNFSVEVKAVGASSGKRKPLWTHTISLNREDGRYAAQDVLGQLLGAICGDRPTTADALNRALGGSSWEEPSLPW